MRDRSAGLIVQAAASGVLDCSKIDPYDKQSTIRASLLLQEVERQISEKHAFARLLKSLAMLTTANAQMIDPDTPEIGTLVQNMMRLYANSLWPISDEELKRNKKNEVQQAIEHWEQTFGVAIDGPEVKEMAAALEAYYKAGDAVRQKQLDDEQAVRDAIARRRKR